MKILVSEAVEVIFHQHNWLKEEWSEGKFGKSLRWGDTSVVIRSHLFDDVFKVYQIKTDHYIVFSDGIGQEGKTVKEAVDKLFVGHESSASFEFKIGG